MLDAPHHSGVIRVVGDAANHLVKVLRISGDASFVVCDGRGYECTCGVVEISRGKSPEVIADRESEWHQGVVAHPLQIHMVQAMTKPDNVEHVLRSCTELGIAQFSLVHTLRSKQKKSADTPGSADRHWTARLGSIAQSASEQSGRADLVQLNQVGDFVPWIQSMKSAPGLKLVASEKVDCAQSLPAVIAGKLTAPVTIVVGPEGGLSEQEEQLAEGAGFLRFSLGPRILRTETAGPAVVAILSVL